MCSANFTRLDALCTVDTIDIVDGCVIWLFVTQTKADKLHVSYERINRFASLERHTHLQTCTRTLTRTLSAVGSHVEHLLWLFVKH